MRKNKNDTNAEKKEKIIMIASSVLVLTALTMTGIYMNAENKKTDDNGYTLDFTKLNALEEKASEIAREQALQQIGETAKASLEGNIEDDLDYPPVEVDSGRIEISKKKELTSPIIIEPEIPEAPKNPAAPEIIEESHAAPEVAPVEDTSVQTVAEPADVGYVAKYGLRRPVDSEVLIPFCMDGSVYFSTLDQYKYNPAVIFVASEGMEVRACADGTVVSVFDDAEIGRAVTVDVGGDFLLTYGQLSDISVAVGSTMKAGEVIAKISEPTKYFRAEGANLYLKLTLNGEPIDPESLFQ